jgi:hypothetical protein
MVQEVGMGSVGVDREYEEKESRGSGAEGRSREMEIFKV